MYDLESNDSRNVLSWCRLNCVIFFTKYKSNCSMRSRLSTSQVIFKCYCKKHLLPNKMLFLHFDLLEGILLFCLGFLHSCI